MTRAIASLAQKGLAFKANDPTWRITEEELGLKRLRHRDDFLSSYNEVVRYMFILSLREGYDIRQDRVHPALRAFINDFACLGDGDIADLVAARHSLKYDGTSPTMAIRMLLSRILYNLSALYDLKGGTLRIPRHGF